MSDSPSKRARERRKAQKRRDKKSRFENRPPETEDEEAIAARYLDPDPDAVEEEKKDDDAEQRS